MPTKATGICIAIVHREDDDKLVVVPEGKNMTDDEILAAVNLPKSGSKALFCENRVQISVIERLPLQDDTIELMRRLFPAGIAALAIGGLVVFGYFNRASILVLNPQGPVAAGERSVIIITVLLCSVVVVPVFALLFLFAWKYRASRPHTKSEHEANWDHENVVAEVVWWAVPMIIIGFLSVVAWHSSHALDPYKPLQSTQQPITVEVVALDWKWLFIYPSLGIASVNMLEFPANTPIHFVLTADAPMNSFWIPQLGGQIMVMPGMSTELNLMADVSGDFNGSSANLSGRRFAHMNFTAKSVSVDDFREWVQVVKSSQNTLTPQVYAALSMPSEYTADTTYSTVAPNLYNSIVMKFTQ